MSPTSRENAHGITMSSSVYVVAFTYDTCGINTRFASMLVAFVATSHCDATASMVLKANRSFGGVEVSYCFCPKQNATAHVSRFSISANSH